MTHTKQKNSNGILRQVIAWGWIYGTLSYGQVFEYKRFAATKYMYDLHLGLTTYSSNNVSSTTKETQVTTRNEIHLHRFDCVYEDSSFLEYQSVYIVTQLPSIQGSSPFSNYRKVERSKLL